MCLIVFVMNGEGLQSGDVGMLDHKRDKDQGMTVVSVLYIIQRLVMCVHLKPSMDMAPGHV